MLQNNNFLLSLFRKKKLQNYVMTLKLFLQLNQLCRNNIIIWTEVVNT